MIQTRKKRETIKVDKFFELNEIPDTENHFQDLIHDVRVKTPYGYHKIPSVCRTIKQTAIRLYFTNNRTLECGWEHKLKVNGDWKQVKDIDIENDIIETDNGLTKIRRIHEGKEKILYDMKVDKVRCFYANGVLSHNTWILTSIGAHAVLQGKNVVHYTMELSEHYVGQRYDTVFTHVPSNKLKEKTHIVEEKIKTLKGNLQIKYFPPKGVSVTHIQQHIEKLTMLGNRPDLVIIDYADLMLSRTNRSDSTYQEQGGVYIELRGLSGEIGVPIWTASQTNRCFFVEDLVDTKHGKVQIGTIKEGDEILTHKGYKEVTHVFEKETQPVYEITLKSGKKVKCSLRHEFPVKYGKLKSLESGLKVGDKLFTKKS